MSAPASARSPARIARLAASAARVAATATLAWAVVGGTAFAQGMPSAEEMGQMQKDMQEGMREMQEALKNLDPQTRRQLQELMANPPRGTASAGDAPPVRNNAKLAAVSTRALDGKGLRRHVESLQPKIAAALAPAARDNARAIDAALGKGADYLPRLRAAANGLAAAGHAPEATYLMGKAALASGSADDLNNLAAFLSMQRAEVAALPILYTLDARYPGNSTLLNNLGQARYGLGDSKEAERLLTAATRISPLHPQANATLARIQEARGDKSVAQASLQKALQGGFSDAKVAQLRRNGGRLRYEEVRWRVPMPRDPLGLERFTRPPFPRKAADLPVALAQWAEFNGHLEAEQARLTEQAARLPASSPAELMASARMPFHTKASKLAAFEGERHKLEGRRWGAASAPAMSRVGEAAVEMQRRIEAIDAAGKKKYANVPGGYQREYSCGEVIAAIDDYVGAVAGLEPVQRELNEIERKHINETAFLMQFMSQANEFERHKITLKGAYLALLKLPTEYFSNVEDRVNFCLRDKTANSPRAGKLPDFDDIHCQNIVTLAMPGLGSYVARCNRTEIKLDPAFGPVKASWDREYTGRSDETRWLRASAEISIETVTVGGHGEFDADGLKSGGVSVGVGAGRGKELGQGVKAGPLEIAAQAGVEVGAGVSVEFDRGGVTDIAVSAKAEAKVGNTVGKSDADGAKGGASIGGESRWGWNSGYSGGVSGKFDAGVF